MMSNLQCLTTLLGLAVVFAMPTISAGQHLMQVELSQELPPSPPNAVSASEIPSALRYDDWLRLRAPALRKEAYASGGSPRKTLNEVRTLVKRLQKPDEDYDCNACMKDIFGKIGELGLAGELKLVEELLSYRQKFFAPDWSVDDWIEMAVDYLKSGSSVHPAFIEGAMRVQSAFIEKTFGLQSDQYLVSVGELLEHINKTGNISEALSIADWVVDGALGKRAASGAIANSW